MMGLFRKVIQQLCIEMDMAAQGWRGCGNGVIILKIDLACHWESCVQL
jgi:hypothetical protein